MTASSPFTPEYIRMAKAAEEIQAMRLTPASFVAGDWLTPHATIYGPAWEEPWTTAVKGERDHEVLAVPGEAYAVGHFTQGGETDDRGPESTGYCSQVNDLRDRALVAWIPRLDQLLGILGNAHDFAAVLRGFSYEEVNVEETGECREWHELAIAAVMREKWGKAWRDGQWVKC